MRFILNKSGEEKKPYHVISFIVEGRGTGLLLSSHALTPERPIAAISDRCQMARSIAMGTFAHWYSEKGRYPWWQAMR
jgi:hypothetical protein